MTRAIVDVVCVLVGFGMIWAVMIFVLAIGCNEILSSC